MTTLSTHEPREAPDHILVGVAAVYQVVDAEVWGPHHVHPTAQLVAEMRHQPSYEQHRILVATDGDDAITGFAWWGWADRPDNRDHVWCTLQVHPAVRRRGVGSRLLRAVAEEARARHGARLLDFEVPAAGPGPAFLTRFGARAAYVGHRNVCEVVDLDRSLLEGWIRRAEERCADYELVSHDGPLPEEWSESFAELRHVMNTAPYEDLDYDDEVFTPAIGAADQASWVAQETDWWTVVARHRPTGALAGYSALFLPRLWPDHAWQGDTGVWPDHRDRGLGRWVKAVNALRLLDERPDVAFVMTENAGSNDAMLSINHAMGFRSAGHVEEWQLVVDDALATS